jgi:lipoic acid synthetase
LDQPKIEKKQKLIKPPWFKAQFPSGKKFSQIKDLLRNETLHTVCEEARCPNIGECFNSGTATFMILGDTCTRACGFCAVNSGRPEKLDALEPIRLANTVAKLNLDYVVITSVNRDDVADGGANIFAGCISSIHKLLPECKVEVLIPDFQGNWSALETVLTAGPAVLNHNTETIKEFYKFVRPKGNYERSLELFRKSKEINPSIPTKTGLMVGLGENMDQVKKTIEDIREQDTNLLTIGQYLQPTKKHLPIIKFWHPDEFLEIKEFATALGFQHVESGPLVRSSYHAAEQYAAFKNNQ